jgi:hypothetical protein
VLFCNPANNSSHSESKNVNARGLNLVFHNSMFLKKMKKAERRKGGGSKHGSCGGGKEIILLSFFCGWVASSIQNLQYWCHGSKFCVYKN